MYLAHHELGHVMSIVVINTIVVSIVTSIIN